MTVRMVAIQLAFCILACVPTVKGYCPPLTKAQYDIGYFDPDYFTVTNQADADRLKTCYIFKGGQLFITGSNASGPLIIDGPRHIDELTMSLYNGPNPSFTSVSMNNLISIGSTSIHSGSRPMNFTGWPPFDFTSWPPPPNPQWHLGVLNFPALKKAGSLTISSLDSVHTVNFPSLKDAGFLSITNSPSLHTINAPNIQPMWGMELSNLPSLNKTPSFVARLKCNGKRIELLNTGLTDVSFPDIEALNELHVAGNKNLKSLSLPSLTLVSEVSSAGGGIIRVANNNPNLVLSLPELRTVTKNVDLCGLGKIEIPELRIIGQNSKPYDSPGSLYVGVIGDFEIRQCVNGRPAPLTNFSAPKLRAVEGLIMFDNSPELRSISLPSLRSAKEIRTRNTAAMGLENGILMPRLSHVENVQILGNTSICSFFDNLYCGGVVTGNYSCGKNKAWDSHKLRNWKGMWPLSPPPCAGRGKFDLFHPKEPFDMAEHLEWLSEMIFVNCYLDSSQLCMHGYTFRTGFLVMIGFLIVASSISWRIMKRRLRRWRWQTAQEEAVGDKVMTD